MVRKAADLSRFQVNVEAPPVEDASPPRVRPVAATPLITKGFRVKPEAARQFDMLKAEVSGNGKDKGPALIAEALNLLFKQYGKPPVA
ncbi:MAG: hypothetical protein AB7N91_07640 [Candidatus Tectimicrobiota bacterium]